MDKENRIRWIADTFNNPKLITSKILLPSKSADFVKFPEWVDERIIGALSKKGINSLFSHQSETINLINQGKNVVVVTPTASGKTLCYNLPVIDRILKEPQTRALYLFPTKALSQDQMAELIDLSKLLGESTKIHTYDGDTPQDARKAIRSQAHIVLTNPDMLHSGILPHHTKWIKLFENLAYVVIDELHSYRGVFGSHLANVIRRLKRICEFYGSRPQFICSSATIANPEELASRITGEDIFLVDKNGAPSGGKYFIFYNPPVVNFELGIRQSYIMESSRIAGLFLKNNIQTIIFATSRLAAELLVRYLKDALEKKPSENELIRGYRGGYLPQHRREIEKALREGKVLGVVSTNALELGIDIGSLDTSVIAGYPGSIASTWQQAGRAGRRMGTSVAILVASSSPMDQFIINNPEYFFGSSPEHGLVNPDNPFVLISHLKCAVFELPFSHGEKFGRLDVEDYLELLKDEGVLHRVKDKWHWMSESYPADHISLRNVSSDNFVVVDTTAIDEKQAKKRKIIAEVDYTSAFSMIHPKAIYLCEGVQFEVQEMRYREIEEKVAYVKKVEVDYFTDSISAKGVWIIDTFDKQVKPHYMVEHGEVLVAEKIVGFKKIKFQTMENVGSGEVELPQQEMHTTSCWINISALFLEKITKDRELIIDGLRGITYILHNIAPLFLMCDIRDLGSWLGNRTREKDEKSIYTSREWIDELKSTGDFEPLIFLYDNHPGGIGFSVEIFKLHVELLKKAIDVISKCPCEYGCPSCVGPINEVGKKSKGLALYILKEIIE